MTKWVDISVPIDTTSPRYMWYNFCSLSFYVSTTGRQAGSLDNISRRYAWLKRILKTYEEHAWIFPAHWKASEVLSKSFCDGTRDDFKTILAKAARKSEGKSLDVNLLLSCLQETLDFEQWLERRFAVDVFSPYRALYS